MTNDATDDDMVAAHVRAAEHYEQTLAELIAVTDAKGINRATIGECMKRDRDGIESPHDAELLRAIRTANAAFRDVNEIANRMSVEDLTASNRVLTINHSRRTKH
jgi:hypothetical protein